MEAARRREAPKKEPKPMPSMAEPATLSIEVAALAWISRIPDVKPEPMIEPIDSEDCGPFDYAEVTGLWDEMYPEPEEMVDEDGNFWYVG
jgi:hypothetical protein